MAKHPRMSGTDHRAQGTGSSTKNGANRFPGEFIHFGTPSFPDWRSVVTHLHARRKTWEEPPDESQ